MQRIFLFASAFLGLMLSVAAPLRASEPTDHENPAEIARIQRHLETVEQELLARDVSHLSLPQRANRAAHVRRLREYRERGVFPHNHDFPGRMEPYFVDAHGTLCAMAYLIAESGRRDLVDRVAATRNNARVPELANDPELLAWLDDAGLTAAEAARIQPTYSEPGVSTGYAQATAVAVGTEGAVIAWNLLSNPSKPAGWLPGVVGVAAGGVGMFLGLVSGLSDNMNDSDLFLVNLGAGAISTGVGLHTIYRHARHRVRANTAEVTQAQDGAANAAMSVSVAPFLSADPKGGAGLMLNVRF